LSEGALLLVETWRSDCFVDDLSAVTEALRAYSRATGLHPLMLGGWEVEDEAISPPALLLERLAAIEARPRNYTYGKDFYRAKEAAASLFREAVRLGGAGAALDAENVAVLQNSSQGLLLALTALRERGVRRVVVAAPVYFAAVHICRHLGLEVALVPAADFFTGALDVSRLIHALRGEASALLLTNPAYSLGTEYGEHQLRRLFAALPEETWLLLDETRLGLPWRHDLPWYWADFPARTLILRSPSKIFLLNGMKTSFLFGPAPLLREIERLSEALVGSGAGNAEAVALAYLDAWRAWMQEQQAERIGPLRAWKRALVRRLRAHYAAAEALLSPAGFRLSPVDSGPYALAATERQRWPTLDSVALAREQGVLLMTSEYFYHHSPRWFGFRLHLCGDQARMEEAILRVFSDVQSGCSPVAIAP
jgi:histidinol-phosphate/aromatic aminotransferase/cobyric acid decarboxylase-like protein